MSTPTFTISRTFDAPRELVWEAWTEPRLFARWFGPKGFTGEIKTLDLRAGGVLHSCLRSPDGMEMWAKFVYREVTPPARLVWEHSFADAEGNVVRHPFQAAWPLRLLTTVVLEEKDGKTKTTLTWTPMDASEAEVKAFADGMAGMTQGWGGTFDQLGEFLSAGNLAG
jgi:uncharacterized protein YndB with AHSA1/START domain